MHRIYGGRYDDSGMFSGKPFDILWLPAFFSCGLPLYDSRFPLTAWIKVDADYGKKSA